MKLGLCLLYDPTLLFRYPYPKGYVSYYKDTYLFMFMASILIARALKQPSYLLTDKLIMKICCLYMVEFYSAINMKSLSKCIDIETLY